jgi:hypothetical protein
MGSMFGFIIQKLIKSLAAVDTHNGGELDHDG